MTPAVTDQPELFSARPFMIGYCHECGRRLSDPHSIELGIGPVCRRRNAEAVEVLKALDAATNPTLL